MTIKKDLKALLRAIAVPTDQQLADAHARVAALRDRLETDTREQQRIRDLGDLLDAEDTLYDEAVAALDRGDDQLAERLLRQCSALGNQAAAELLEDLSKRPQVTPKPSTESQIDTAPEPDPSSRPDTLIVLGNHGEKSRISDFWRDRIANRKVGIEEGKTEAKAEFVRLVTGVSSVLWQDDPPLLRKTLSTRCTAGDFGANVICPNGMVIQAKDHRRLWRRAQDSLTLCDYRDSVLLACMGVALTDAAQLRQTSPQRVAADVLMPYPIRCVAPDETVGEVLDYMVAGDYQALPVGDQGAIFGVVTLVDLAGRTRAEQMHAPVAELMHPPVFVRTDTPIDHVRDQLLNGSTGLLVALDSVETVAGYITLQTALAGHTEPEPTPSRNSLLTGTPSRLLLATGV